MKILAIITILLAGAAVNYGQELAAAAIHAQELVAAPFVFGRCSYTGDPHLVPFPRNSTLTSNMYFCQRPGWDILLRNRWILVLVNVGPSPYVILNVC